MNEAELARFLTQVRKAELSPLQQGRGKALSRHSMTVPGLKSEIGLGDVVKTLTQSLGIRTCGGCQQRAAVLNAFMSFKGK
jgi:hypothetical protein